MSKKSFIDSMMVSKPCTEDWGKMHGNDRVRFCDHCAKNVSDLSAVTRKKAMRMVAAAGGNLCVRYLSDPETNRPLFVNPLIHITRRSPGIAAGVMTASIALSTAAYAQEPSPTAPPSSPPVVENTINRGDQNPPARDTPTVVDIEPRATMGMIAFSPSVKYENSLTLAVMNDELEEVRDLIVHGANVNGKEKSKITPLFIAVESGNVEIARLLLDFGAKINVRDNEKKTPLMYIDEDATPELIDLLVTNGAKLDIVDSEGSSALILAAGNVRSEVLKALIDAGTDVNIADKQGQTALMNAADHDDIESVRLLLLAGAKVNARNKDGENAWDLTDNDDIEALLVSYGAEVTEQETEIPAETQPNN